MLFMALLLLCGCWNLQGFTDSELLQLGREKLIYKALDFSEQEIDDNLQKLQNTAFYHDLDKKKILKTLKEEIQDSILFHNARVENSYDYGTLLKALGLAVGAVAVAYAAYYFFNHYYNVYRIERNAIRAEFDKANIKVVYGSSKYFGNSCATDVYLQFPQHTSMVDRKCYQNKLSRLVELLNLLEKKGGIAKGGLLGGSCCAFALGEKSALSMQKFLKPTNHKQCFEKYCLILDKIDKALNE
jgi:hypothetical protein